VSRAHRLRARTFQDERAGRPPDEPQVRMANHHVSPTSRLLWEPGAERVERANISRFMRFVRDSTGNDDIRRYAPLYDFSVRQPERFWSLLWEFCGVRAHGDHAPVLVQREHLQGARWFPNVTLNFAQNLLRFRDERIAIAFRNDRGERRQLSYAQLHAQVGRLAHALKGAGIGVGDRVAGLLPNIPEAIVAMLATSSIGAIWSSCPPQATVHEAVAHLRRVAPKLLFASDGGGTGSCDTRSALDALSAIERVVVITHGSNPAPLRDAVGWSQFVGDGEHAPEYVALPFDHPLYMTGSGGTPAAPAECSVHGAGGTLLRHLKEIVLHADLKREDRILSGAQCGWSAWHWFASTLAVGATLVLHDGALSDHGALWDLADEFGISAFAADAGWIRASRTAGARPRETHKLLSLKTILWTGTPPTPEDCDYVHDAIKQRVLLARVPDDANAASSFALGCPVLPEYRGELQCRALGLKVEVLDRSGRPVRGAAGDLACTAPFPSMPLSFRDDPEGARYREAFFSRFPNAWCNGERAVLTERDGIVACSS
jgi:acetoacetyl-CoA synthetase